MANEENLIPVTMRSKEDAKKIQIAGGKARGEQRKREKTFKEIAQAMMGMTAPDEIVAKIKEKFPELDDISNKEALIFAQYAKALKGDSKAFEVVRDTGGEKPVDRSNLTVDKPIVVRWKTKDD